MRNLSPQRSAYGLQRKTAFDPVRKRTEGRVERDGETFTAVKGAAQILIGLSNLSDERAAEVQQMDSKFNQHAKWLKSGARPR